MATQPSEEQGNSNQTEPAIDIENVLASVGSASSQSGGAPENSREEVDGSYYRPLLQAAFRGNWEFAKKIFEQDATSKTAKITSRSETLLHIAALSARDQFLENLVDLLSLNLEVLEMVDCDGRTALHNAVLSGRIRMVKALVRSNPKLTQLADNEGRVPLEISAREASMHKEIAWYLAKNTIDDEPSCPLIGPFAINIIIYLSYAGHHDITLYLVDRYPHLLTMKGGADGNVSLLGVLASMDSHFPSRTRLSVLEALIYKCISVNLNESINAGSKDPALQCLTGSLWNAVKIIGVVEVRNKILEITNRVPTIKRIHEVKLRHVAAVELAKQACTGLFHLTTTDVNKFFQEQELLGRAISRGIPELVKLWIKFFPELVWLPTYNKSWRTYAVEYRQESILRLFLKGSSTNELSFVPALTRQESIQIMLAVAQYTPNFGGVNKVSGAAFGMQRELQWFRAMEMCIIPDVRTANIEGKTFWMMFKKEHERLLHDGEMWIKETTNQCMVVSTLIATVLFAAAFTVPGGNDNSTGIPLLLGKDSLLIFAISDTLGLFSSVMAIMLFLAILSSQYECEDFLRSLPKKIIMGFSFLFLSLAFMLVAFAATFTIVLDKRLEWVFIPISLLASLTVFIFLALQLPCYSECSNPLMGQASFVPWDLKMRHNSWTISDDKRM